MEKQTIATEIKAVLAKYEIQSFISVITCDTTNTNSGSKNGVVSSLQNYCQQISGQIPQYIDCQHHILDRVLKLAMDSVLGGNTSSPNISHSFVEEVIADYESLKRRFGSQLNSPTVSHENKGWRDDTKFLFHLMQKKENVEFENLCSFIAKYWSEAWFTDQKDWKLGAEILAPALRKYTAMEKCFMRHWVQEDSAIPGIEHSNRCPERAIKIVQDIQSGCKSSKTLNDRFVLTNDYE